MQITNPDDPTLPNMVVTLRRNAQNPLILDIFVTQIAAGATPAAAANSATPTQSLPISCVGKVVVNGLFHDNKVFVDVSKGDIAVPVEFNGTGHNSTGHHQQTVPIPYLADLGWVCQWPQMDRRTIASIFTSGDAAKPLPLVNNSIGTIFNNAHASSGAEVSNRDLPSASVHEGDAWTSRLIRMTPWRSWNNYQASKASWTMHWCGGLRIT